MILSLEIDTWYDATFSITGDPTGGSLCQPVVQSVTTKLASWCFFDFSGRLLISEFEILTHLPLDKMAAILADYIFKCIFLYENDRIPIQISLKLVPKSQIDNKPALLQVMAWCRTGDKHLPEPMMTQLSDAYMRH